MTKVKMIIEVNLHKEVEINLPFYVHIEEEIEETFVKITANEIKQITFYQYGKNEICIYKKTGNYLPVKWFENKSNSKKWKEAVKTIIDLTKML